MQIRLYAIAILALNLNTVTHARISKLETCNERLEKALKAIIQNIVTVVDNTDLKPFYFTKPTNCVDLLNIGYTESGVYTIYPKSWNGTFNSELSVYCDMQTDGGGWIVFQRRGDYHQKQNFYQNWETYKRGFGQLDKEFWLGNENLFVLTNQENVTLRVDLENFENETRYAVYDKFKISNCEDKYRLIVDSYSGNAGDSLKYHNKYQFATFDKDTNTCADKSRGAWWYVGCHESNLNGLYKKGKSDHYDVVSWNGFKGDRYSLKKSEMKIRPITFSKPEYLIS